jgi:hypothetical protein
MKHLQIRSKLNQTTRARGIHVINSFILSYVQEYETQGATSELLQSVSLFLNVKFNNFLYISEGGRNLLRHVGLYEYFN